MVKEIVFTKKHELHKSFEKGDKIKVYPPLFEKLVEELKVAKLATTTVKKGKENV